MSTPATSSASADEAYAQASAEAMAPHTRTPDDVAVDALPDQVARAMQRQEWTLALHLLTRLQQGLGPRTPAGVHALRSTCLHHLGQYEAAEAAARDGWGTSARLLTVGRVFTEAELRARWGAAEAPVVSIICTAYNHERYIATALAGFLSQTTAFPFEILVHDDASTDRTPAIIREWQARYPSIIRPTLQTENQFRRGVRPFELLLAQARGRYVATCEGDDWWVAANKLQTQVDFLDAHPEYAAAAHNYYLYDEPSLGVRPWLATRETRVLSERQLKGVARLLWLPTLMFRRVFDALPPERALAPIGDQFLTSYLGTRGPAVYFESLLGAVRRQNDYSTWSPLDATAKERVRVRTWLALVRLHMRLGDAQAVDDLMNKVGGAALPPVDLQSLLTEYLDDAPIGTAESTSQAA